MQLWMIIWLFANKLENSHRKSLAEHLIFVFRRSCTGKHSGRHKRMVWH